MTRNLRKKRGIDPNPGIVTAGVTDHRAFGDRHGGRSYRAHGRAGAPAGHVTDPVNSFRGKRLLKVQSLVLKLRSLGSVLKDSQR